MYIFYSKVGDSPERILYSHVHLSSENWNDWKASPPREVLRSELQWEGADLPPSPSSRGEMGVMVNQLQDPAIFEDEHKHNYQPKHIKYNDQLQQ